MPILLELNNNELTVAVCCDICGKRLDDSNGMVYFADAEAMPEQSPMFCHKYMGGEVCDETAERLVRHSGNDFCWIEMTTFLEQLRAGVIRAEDADVGL